MKSKEKYFYEAFAAQFDNNDCYTKAWESGWQSAEDYFKSLVKEVMNKNNSPVLREALIQLQKELC